MGAPLLHYVYLYGHQRVVRGGRCNTNSNHVFKHRDPAGDPWGCDFIGPPSPDHLMQVANKEALQHMRGERYEFPRN